MLSKAHISPFLGSFPAISPWKKLIRNYKNLPFLPFYHAIGSPDALPHIRHLYAPSNFRKFAADLDQILSLFKPISLGELIRFSKNEIEFNEPVFHLSFDDGLRQVYEIAMPILKQKGIPATIFVNSDFVDNQSLFFRYQVSLIAEEFRRRNAVIPSSLFNIRDKNDPLIEKFALELHVDFDAFLSEYRPYMNFKQLEEWTSQGFTLGAHSLNHPYYHCIDLKEQKRQTVGSLDYLRQQFHIDYRAFAFPFSDEGVPPDFFSTLYQNQQLDISFGTSGVKDDEWALHFQRTGMERGKRSAASIISGEYLYYFLLNLLGRNVRRR